ncbi:two-component system, sensor histidine kinase YesM [Anaerocolumna aminovalerica]|uniref:Two-component system, sensor histidine kinase YesM n=2 Tax=Anaerocolumna aminovalerica TaxID=1527 RepID=A0A1I5DAR0_9FIRM|nr:two-component system, sensor histidine kinase YesM [Anaerocolumna aminovalerica]
MSIVSYTLNEGIESTMKHKSRYLSFRVGILFCLMTLLTLIMLSLFMIIALIENRYILFTVVGCTAFIVLLYLSYKWVYKPYQETNKTLSLFSEGSILQGIFDLRCPLSEQMDDATKRFKVMLDTKELFKLSKKQAEYLALQNQINPHFLYNTLEGIRSEALCAGMDGVANMTEALGTFFRYTISNVDHLVTLEDELYNIQNYYMIQQYRFGDRLNVSVEYEEEEKDVLMLLLPKLTLQPIVENSIYHGIERKIGKGNLRIKIQSTTDRLIIVISDDGLGIEKEQLDLLNKKLRSTYLEDVTQLKGKQGGIAIVNVNNRIKLLFGDEYGIYITSTIHVGTDVTITLPKVKE